MAGHACGTRRSGPLGTSPRKVLVAHKPCPEERGLRYVIKEPLWSLMTNNLFVYKKHTNSQCICHLNGSD